MGKPMKNIEKQLRQMINYITLPLKSYLDDFIGALDLDRNFVTKKLHNFNTHCLSMEFCHYLKRTGWQLTPKILSLKIRVHLDPKLKTLDASQLQANNEQMMNEY
jgi:hypothetical protein